MRKHLGHARLKYRNEFFLEPRIALQPQIITRAGMRQRDQVGPVFPPCMNHLRQCPGLGGKVISPGILADDQGELQMLQMRQ